MVKCCPQNLGLVRQLIEALAGQEGRVEEAWGVWREGEGLIEELRGGRWEGELRKERVAMGEVRGRLEVAEREGVSVG